MNTVKSTMNSYSINSKEFLIHNGNTTTIGGNNNNKILMMNSKEPVRDVKYLQNHEKILEAQNKWTGNGRFIVREKSSFLVSYIFK